MLTRLILAGAALASTPAAAANDWWVAETDHFRVVSEGGQETARDVAKNLELLDKSMRLFRGLPLDAGELDDSAKVTIYQTGTSTDIGRLANSAGVAGFFSPRAGNSVAFVPIKADRDSRGRLGTRSSTADDLRPEQVLFHEYAHYFSRQHAPAAYPFWYSEGFAELFATIEFTETGFNLGEPPRYRGAAISQLSFKVEDILNLEIEDNKVSGLDIARQYAYGWMFTSYLSFEPSRVGQLADYLRLVNTGTPNLKAAKQAFGDLSTLQRDLEIYRRGRVRAISVQLPGGADTEVELRKLDDAQAASMPLHIRSTAGVTERQAQSLVAESRRLVALYPDAPSALDAAMEAEFDAENYSPAQSMAKRLIDVQPDSVRAPLYLAMIALERAKTDPGEIQAARRHFIEANRIDSERPDILLGYFNSFVLANETIPEDALLGLEKAFRIAPFDAGIRRSLAYLLLTEQRDTEAFVILGPAINVPHASGDKIKELRELVKKAEEGDRQPLIDELRPKLDSDVDEEDE